MTVESKIFQNSKFEMFQIIKKSCILKLRILVFHEVDEMINFAKHIS